MAKPNQNFLKNPGPEWRKALPPRKPRRPYSQKWATLSAYGMCEALGKFGIEEPTNIRTMKPNTGSQNLRKTERNLTSDGSSSLT